MLRIFSLPLRVTAASFYFKKISLRFGFPLLSIPPTKTKYFNVSIGKKQPVLLLLSYEASTQALIRINYSKHIHIDIKINRYIVKSQEQRKCSFHHRLHLLLRLLLLYIIIKYTYTPAAAHHRSKNLLQLELLCDVFLIREAPAPARPRRRPSRTSPAAARRAPRSAGSGCAPGRAAPPETKTRWRRYPSPSASRSAPWP